MDISATRRAATIFGIAHTVAIASIGISPPSLADIASTLPRASGHRRFKQNRRQDLRRSASRRARR